MLLSVCKAGPLPVMIHEDYTNIFVVWAYLRAVIKYAQEHKCPDLTKLVIV